MFSNLWEKIKRFFNRAWSIFLMRVTALTGLITAALASAEWGPFVGAITTAGVSRTQALILGAFLAIHGILLELARRQGTKTTPDGNLVPKELETK